MTTEEFLRHTSGSELFRTFDIRVDSAEPGHVVISMPVTSKVHQYTGIMNGGVSVLLAESAASIGAVVSNDLTKVTPVGIEINANHLRAISKGRVTAEAKSVYQGKTLSVWSIEITDERKRLICISRITLSHVQKPAIVPRNA